MIVIFSNKLDISTDLVIDYLNYFKAEYIRINREIKILGIQIEISDKEQNFIIQFENGKKLVSSEILSYWYRKDGISFQEMGASFSFGKRKKTLISFVKTEKEKVKNVIELLIQGKFGIGSFEKHRAINKLEVLLAAKDIGFHIPHTLITNQRDIARNGYFNMIIKAISEVVFYYKGKSLFIAYTSKYPNYLFNDLPSLFVPSLFQNEIEKQYELRIFYLDKECYGMAIFSQNDKKTSVDFRKYNYQKPNRWIPYKVNESFQEKIIQLMEFLGLNTGSLDFIVDKDDQIYFLEINPSGQFGMVSYPCNYYLERKIASKLICLHEEKNILNQK